MATKYITLKGKSEWCKPWDFQIDREFEEEGDTRGGNFATNIILDEESVAEFNSLNAKAKLKDGNKLTLRRYERHPVIGELGPVKVNGVEEGQEIGNNSDISVLAEVYDYTFKGRPGKALRWTAIDVLNLVEYKAPETSKPAVGVPVI